MSDYKVTCRDCKRKVPFEDTQMTSRYGGGNYRRGGRWFHGQTCARCIEAALLYLNAKDGQPVTFHNLAGYEVGGLLCSLNRLIASGRSDLDEDRWRAMFPDNRAYITFEQFFEALRNGVARYNVVGQ